MINVFLVLFVADFLTTTIYSDDNPSSSGTEAISDGTYRYCDDVHLVRKKCFRRRDVREKSGRGYGSGKGK